MSSLNVRKEIDKIIQSGYRHKAYEHEESLLRAVLIEKQDPYVMIQNDIAVSKLLLGPDPIRSWKNGLICFITTLCRKSISYGADSDYCFVVSDYYINMAEKKRTLQELKDLLEEIVDMYRELIEEQSLGTHSVYISKALSFIKHNLFLPLSVQEVAAHINLSSSHFSKLFLKEIGVSPSDYIEALKMKEAISMLKSGQYKILEVAEVLGYCSASHFTKRFHIYYGISPKKMLHANF